MNIKITIKQLGKKRSKISEKNFTLDNKPNTVRQLIEEAVHICVWEHNSRMENKDINQKPLTNEQIIDMSEIGKIAFDINYNDKIADVEKAVLVAIQAFEDGLIRIFKGEDELTDINQKIDLKEDERLTFLRLTMLAGRMY